MLLEIYLDFNIINADGALSILINNIIIPLPGRNLAEFLSESDKAVIDVSLRSLKSTNRIGPILIKMKSDKGKIVEFAMFAGQLPMQPGSIYLAISFPYRLGMDSYGDDFKTDVERREEFFGRLDKLVTDSDDDTENLMVTVMETPEGENVSSAKQHEMEGFLKGLSVGGNHAAKLADNKYALVHSKEDDVDQADMAQELALATGMALTSATIDANDAVSGEEDGIKALIFSLQRFAEGSVGFNAESFAAKGGNLISETTARVSEFRRILNEGDFDLVYQPIVALRSGVTHHFEALTRFTNSGEHGNQFEMICFAEDVGLIIDFDKAVLKRTIEKVKPQAGLASAPNIAVNISGKSLSTPAFVEDLLKTLKESSALAKNVSLEITESSKIHDLIAMNKIIQEIRGIGFRVYMDDFGAGAAGFEYLRDLQVDGVKIDGAYIRDAVSDKKTRAFLRSIVTLCQDLGINTVGEWVETKEHADLLAQMGVTYAQGFYFGKPSPSLIPTRARASAAN